MTPINLWAMLVNDEVNAVTLARQEQEQAMRLVIDAAPDIQSSASMRRSLILLTACVWLGSFLLSTLRDLADPPAGFAVMTMIRFAFAGFGALLCLPLHTVLAHLESRSPTVQLAAGILLSVLAAIAYTQLTFVAMRATGLPGPNYGAAWQFYNTVYWSLFFIAWSALRIALAYSRQAAINAARANDAEALARDAQIRALRYQVDPHFLFNALNSVSALVVADRREHAEAMLAKLAAFFRASTALDPRDDVTLCEEMAFERLFLEIEQVRHPDLAIDITMAADVATATVPALILQPLVENAVKFGVARRDGPARIAIVARRIGDRFLVTVENDASGTGANPGTGTGLTNVESRLRARFGTQSAVTAGACPEGGYRVDVTMPFERT